MLSRFSMLWHMATLESLVWVPLGVEWITVVAIALSAFAQRTRGVFRARSRQRQCTAFFEQLRVALQRAAQSGIDPSRNSVQEYAGSLVPILPHDPVGAFITWRATHAAAPTAVEQKIAMLVAQAEGSIGRLLDFAKVTSPLLGLAGTLLGLQHAFSQAHLGKAAVEAGLATALYTTFVGIVIAIAAFFTLRFLVEPLLARLEAELWEAESRWSEVSASAWGHSDGRVPDGPKTEAPQDEPAASGLPHPASTTDRRWWDATGVDGEDPFKREPFDG